MRLEKTVVAYIHGKGGSPAESQRFAPLFPGCRVVGLDYRGETPWEAGMELRSALEALREDAESILLIANSIGAFFAMHAGIHTLIRKAFFISPIVDMEKLIRGMMAREGVTEDELRARGEISTAFGETLSWEYLRYVRTHPIRWPVPTAILFGSGDGLTSLETMKDFADKHNASLTVMENGEHWFHTEEQLRFLDDWLRKNG